MIARNDNKRHVPPLWRREDAIVVGLAAVCAVALLAAASMRGTQALRHPRLEILVGNEVYGIYDLDEDREIRISENNVCEIRGGQVRMTYASCPDKLCVHSRPVGAGGGSIVCLPGRIVLHIVDAENEEREVDSIAG